MQIDNSPQIHTKQTPIPLLLAIAVLEKSRDFGNKSNEVTKNCRILEQLIYLFIFDEKYVYYEKSIKFSGVTDFPGNGTFSTNDPVSDEYFAT